MAKAQEQFAGRLDDGDSIQRGKFALTARLHPDDSHGAPWDEEDGHGPVSDWRNQNYAGRYDKAPGEVLLHSDGRCARFYDMRAAQALALRDGWDAKPYNTGQETKRQQAAKAARSDFERLRRWCDDQWAYVGIEVVASQNGIKLGSASLWGIESDAGDYLTETANELADEALKEAREAIARLAA